MFQSTTDEQTTRLFTGLAPGARRGTPAFSRLLTAPACALALALLLTGNVAAVQLERDDSAINAPLVTPRRDSQIVWSQQLKFKLATKAGYNILVFG